MTTSRYAEALAPTQAWLAIEHRGWGVVVGPPSEQRELATALATAMPERPHIELDAATTPDWFAHVPGAFVTLEPDLGAAALAAILRMLNVQRDLTSDRGVWVLVLSPRELDAVRRHAPDLASTFRSFDLVKFIPRAMSSQDVRVARAELHAHYAERFGRLDLRGFIRSENEDVSFPIEEIFQPLRATPHLGLDSQTKFLLQDGPLADQLTTLRREHCVAPALIVGSPGSGKSFFLRWCAITASRAERFFDVERSVPVYVPLAAMRAAAPSAVLVDDVVASLLDARLAIAHALHDEAGAGRVLFLLDGLDEVAGGRAAVVAAVGALHARYPASMIVITSRPAGLAPLPFDVDRFDLQGLDDHAIRALFTRWYELYEIGRLGAGGAAPGRAIGEELAAQVLSSPMLGELARFPLMATIIAIVHRAGVRLPDHRVELYEHVMRILVERWNLMRSREAGASAAPAIRTADAIRLLGPVAHEMIATGRDGAIDEASLRALLTRQLQRGTIRAIASADDAIDVFRNTLGLLVEQAPGIHGFLHKTVGEFLAAHDIVRTGALEELLQPATCFAASWRETLLLALGIVGSIHVNDDRLDAAVRRVVESARARRATFTDEVPAFLAAIVADDPALSPDLATALCDETVGAWRVAAGSDARLWDTVVACSRILRGAWRESLTQSLRRAHGGGLGLRLRTSVDVVRAWNLVELMQLSGFVVGPFQCEAIVAALLGGEPGDLRAELYLWPVSLEAIDGDELAVGADADEFFGVLLRHGAGPLVRAGLIFPAEGDVPPRYELFPVEDRAGQITVVRPRGTPTSAFFELRFPPPRDRRALVPAVLAAWRELAEKYPGSPQPPASVEEAIAIYGTPAADTPQ